MAPKSLTPYMNKLIVHPPQLTPQDLVSVLDILIEATKTPEDEKNVEIQMAAFLALLRGSGVDHYPQYIAAAAQRLMEAAQKIETPEKIPSLEDGFVDIVGTGGDSQNTFNVSTTASIVVAGMGIKVCKHGGKASTSTSGAGDLLTCLGINLAKVTNKTAPSVLFPEGKVTKPSVENPIYCFLFAPVFHPAMAAISPLRKQLGIPTIFNILGPLLNPVVPIKARIVGVFSESLGEVFAKAVYNINKEFGYPESKFMIVWGTEGLDEISPAGTTKVWVIEGKDEDGNPKVVTKYLHPNDFGLPVHPLDTVRSGTPAENAAIVHKLINNELPENHPILDYVLMNSAALAHVEGTAKDWKHGVELAKESVRSGTAKRALQQFVDQSNKM